MDKLKEFRSAIVLYLTARVEIYGRSVKPEETAIFKNRAEQDAGKLFEAGEQGIEYGAMGNKKVRLCYSVDKGFFLDQAGLNRRDFERFQGHLAKQFGRYDLKFTAVPVSW